MEATYEADSRTVCWRAHAVSLLKSAETQDGVLVEVGVALAALEEVKLRVRLGVPAVKVRCFAASVASLLYFNCELSGAHHGLSECDYPVEGDHEVWLRCMAEQIIEAAGSMEMPAPNKSYGLPPYPSAGTKQRNRRRCTVDSQE